ncbi:hypothetical protein CS559_03105 [Dickeya solani]|nr:hypothetical protein CTB90_03017 [Dickeya solani]RJR95492.1 hypothetical protein CS559_03105 [Dickeya solani]
MPGAGGGHRQAVAVHIAVVRQHIDGHRRVFQRGGRVVHRHRRVIDRRDAHRHGRGGGAAVAVADGVADGVAAVVVGGRRIGQRTVGVDHHRAVSGRRGGHRQAVAVHIAVIRQHIDRHRRVFQRGGRIIGRHRCIVHRRHRDRHNSGGRAALTVADGVADGVAAVVVGRRRIGQRAVGVNDYRAVSGAGGSHRQRIAVHIAVVRQHIHRHRRVFCGGRRVVDRHRCIVHRRDGHRYRTRRAGAQSVTDLIGNGVAAVVVGGRRIGQRTVGVDHHCAVPGAGRCHGQRITIGIGIIGQHVHRHRRIFRRGSAVRVGDRRRIDMDGDGGGFRGAITGNGIGKRVIPQVTAIRGVDRVAGAINHHRTV